MHSDYRELNSKLVRAEKDFEIANEAMLDFEQKWHDKIDELAEI